MAPEHVAQAGCDTRLCRAGEPMATGRTRTDGSRGTSTIRLRAQSARPDNREERDPCD